MTCLIFRLFISLRSFGGARKQKAGKGCETARRLGRDQCSFARASRGKNRHATQASLYL